MGLYSQYSQQPWRQKPADIWSAPSNVYVRRARESLGLLPTLPVTRKAVLALPKANQTALMRVQWLAKLKPEPEKRPWWWMLALGAIGWLSIGAARWLKRKQ